MSLAAEARAQVRRRPFLHAALRAGVLNHAAGARLIGVGDVEPVTTALRRYADDLPAYDTRDQNVRVAMRSGLGFVDADDEPGADAENQTRAETDESAEGDALLSVGGVRLVPDAGSLTGVLATGEVDALALSHLLARLDAEEIGVVAAGVGGDSLLVVVNRRDGPDAVRIAEDALEAVPDSMAEAGEAGTGER